MKRIALAQIFVVAALVGMFVVAMCCGAAYPNEPTPAVPCYGAELADWEDYARLKWTESVPADCVKIRQMDQDGTAIDLVQRIVEDGHPNERIWEVTKDWRRGVSKLAYLKGSYPQKRFGLLLVNSPRIDSSEIVRCRIACREVGILFTTVDQWGKFR